MQNSSKHRAYCLASRFWCTYLPIQHAIFEMIHIGSKVDSKSKRNEFSLSSALERASFWDGFFRACSAYRQPRSSPRASRPTRSARSLRALRRPRRQGSISNPDARRNAISKVVALTTHLARSLESQWTHSSIEFSIRN